MRPHFPAHLVAGILLVAAGARSAPTDTERLATLLFDAHQRQARLPLVSAVEPELDVETAYAVQSRYVRRRIESGDGGAVGFKAAATATAMQAKFGLDGPIGGVLLGSMLNPPEMPVEQQEGKGLMIETEVGFVVGEAMTEPVADIDTFRAHIRHLSPAIELPCLNYEDMEGLKAVDIIASNTAAFQFIVGGPTAKDAVDPNQVAVTLTLNGEPVNTGAGTDIMGDQWKAALWLANTMLRHGWTLQPGQVLITGAMGKMTPARAGTYRADFGALGVIQFEVR